MLENIISLVKDQVTNKISQDPEIPEEKRGEVAQTATASIISGLKDYITPENISSLTSMLGVGGQGPQPHDSPAIQQSDITQGVQSNVVSSLMSKSGLSQGSAKRIALMVVPAVMAIMSKKAHEGGGSGFNIGSLVSAFTGNHTSSSASGGGSGIMDMVGKFFNK